MPAYLGPEPLVRRALGRRDQDRYKLQIGYNRNFWKGNETRITLPGERQSGRPFGFTMSDAASGRSPVFGVEPDGPGAPMFPT